jgi:hypothetical protein
LQKKLAEKKEEELRKQVLRDQRKEELKSVKEKKKATATAAK